MAAAAILDFRNPEFLFAVGIWRAQTHHCTKFRHSSILRFFEFSWWPPPPSCIIEIAKFYWLLESTVWRRISMSNFVKIGQFVVRILRFFDFSRWRSPPSWIFENVKFYLLTVCRGPSCITIKFCQNWSYRCGDVAIFRIFKMSIAAILDFWNREILLDIWVQTEESHQYTVSQKNDNDVAHYNFNAQ